MESKKYWIGVLHSHLPFVKHPEYENFLEEWWLFEAINETYIPLLMVFKRLDEEGVNFKLTVSLTPTLMEMFCDKNLKEKYKKHLDKLIELSEKELIRTRTNFDEHLVASFYNGRLKTIKEFFFDFLNENVLSGYRYFKDKGNIEIITSAATHALLPFIKNREFVRLQIEIGKKVYEKHLNSEPKGIWLPECAYFSGLIKELRDENFKFFFVESHALSSDVAQKHGVYAFRRDENTAKVVWSSKEGYPGDFNYRDFYRDIGYDMPYYYIKDYLPGGIRTFTGLKYYKITGNTDYKELYNPEAAIMKAKEHAYNFHFNLDKNLDYRLKNNSNVVISLYDAELFGHWWFEGVDFLYYLFKVFNQYKVIEPITPSEYLNIHPNHPVEEPKDSSWGFKGYYDVWLNRSNSWIYNHLHHAEDRILQLIKGNAPSREIITLMIKELFLAESSDWAFLITNKDNKSYAEEREKEHIYKFNRLDKMLFSKKLDKSFINKLKLKDSIFEDMEFYGSLDRLRRNIF